MSKYEVMAAISVGGNDIELVGRVGDEIFDVKLTEYAKQLLREVELGSVSTAIEELVKALNLEFNVMDVIRAELNKIPVVRDVVNLVLDAQVFLTDLEYDKPIGERDGRFVLGVLIDYQVDLGYVKLSRVGVKIDTNPTDVDDS